MRSRPAPTISDEGGYTLVELMVAAVVLAIGVLATFGLLDGANRTTVANDARIGATNLSREVLEGARGVDYDQLNPTQIVAALQARPDLAGSSTSPWQIERRGITFTITVSACTFDDPKDNVAATPPPNVCTPQAPVSAAATGLSADVQPDDFRRVTVTLAWNTGNGNRSVAETTLISNPSGGFGPRLTTFTAPPDNTSQFTGNGTTAQFPTVTTNAAAVRWNSDGSPSGSGDSTAGPTTWTTIWTLGSPATPVNPPVSGAIPAQYSATTVLDGTYTVTAQAYDDRGIAGDSRAAILPLNRSLPLTVTGFEAGRDLATGGSNGVVEFSWDPNPERDIVGYQVYNAGPDNVLGNGNDSLVCSTANVNDTSCTDTSPSSGSSSYFVQALDRTDITSAVSAARRSPYARIVSVGTVASTAAAPAAPLTLLALPDPSTGDPKLTWTHLSLASVRFFRIYRDNCCNVADRYDSTTGNGTSWVDPDPGVGLSHRYWVTAVGPAFNESGPSPRADWLP
ncbi:MAG: hypothetical protein QOE28_2960 [Solirubrobacteraceae bacterium]|nr:hypothetical protein [Solirubrobacteraceae bacterium]